jgi:Taurine catabolism dioxygenase TauD, TfdA family
VWRSADVADTTEWTVTLTDHERDEIVSTANGALSAGLSIQRLTPDVFALPSLAGTIERVAHDLDRGRGFVLVRRFPLDRLGPAATELAYIGLGLHLGNPVSQDAHGTLLGHVRDEGQARDSPAVRLYRTRERQDFHTDGADIVGLLCLQRAKSGGESKLASSYAV